MVIRFRFLRCTQLRRIQLLRRQVVEVRDDRSQRQLVRKRFDYVSNLHCVVLWHLKVRGHVRVGRHKAYAVILSEMDEKILSLQVAVTDSVAPQIGKQLE